ncbi:MAG: MFS transporter [Cocleimonas sp.]
MSSISPQSGKQVLFASMLLMMVFGSIHVFSIFLEPMEAQFKASRSAVSLIYSLSLVTLTISVFFGHKLYGLMSPALFVVATCLLAVFGLCITAFSNHLLLAYLGFGVIFGFANGLGYGYTLHMCAQSNKQRQGLAIGLITASYALGPVLMPWPLSYAIQQFGLTGALLAFVTVIILIMPIAAFAFHLSGSRLQLAAVDKDNLASNKNNNPNLVRMLWLSYGLAVTAGLMTLGHATAIAKTGGVSNQLIVIAPIIIAVFNICGSLLGGWMVDKFSVKTSLIALPLLSAISLFALSQFLSGQSILIGLAAVGFTYGAIIAAYPAVIAVLFGSLNSIKIYGLVFTAWGAAGFFGPWFAGILYDNSGNYTLALLIAAIAGLLSAVVAYFVRDNTN